MCRPRHIGRRLRYCVGNSVTMDRKNEIPLIPSRANVGLPCPDTSALIRDIFQEDFRDQVVRSFDAQYLYDTAQPNTALREYAEDVIHSHESHARLVQEIGYVERELMEHHARHLMLEHRLETDSALAERLLLARPPLFCDPHPVAVAKFCLVTSDDLLPPPHQAVLDFRVADFTEKKRRICRKPVDASQTAAVVKEPSSKHVAPSNIRAGTRCQTQSSTETTCTTRTTPPLVFVARPRHVFFGNFKAGVVYKSTVSLQNVTTKAAKFDVMPLVGSKFSAEWTPLPGHTKLVAAGMSVTITVSFRSDTLDDCHDTLSIRVKDGEMVEILLKAFRDPPDLRVPGMQDVLINSMTVGQKIVLTTVECGRCFLGNRTEMVIRLVNTCGEGRFWLCSEEQWCQAEINQVSMDNSLCLPPFTISPLYFSLEPDDVIDLRVTFVPTEPDSQVEKLYVMCDNCAVRTLEICGDGLVFSPMYMQFQNMDKEFAIDLDDDEQCRYWLNMGKMVSGNCVTKIFMIKNSSDIALRFHWGQRRINVLVFGPRESDHIDLPTESCSISPREGVFRPRQMLEFEVSCCLDEQAAVGHYRHVLSLYIEDIPQDSLPASSKGLQVFPKSCRPDSAPLFDILVAEMELWLDCMPLIVTLEPWVVWIAGDTLKVGGERVIVRRVVINNESIAPIEFEWENAAAIKDKNILFGFKPSKGVVAAKSCFKCKIAIMGTAPGPFRQKIRCLVNGIQGPIELLLVGEVSGPLVIPSCFELDFGIVKLGCRASYPFSVISKTTLPATWLLQELSYDFESRRLRLEDSTHTSIEAGFLCHRGSMCDVSYDLCTRHAGIQCSLLVLSTATAASFTPQAYILVVAEVVEPKLYVRAPPRDTALLVISKKLYVGHSVWERITLRNFTKVEASYMWGEPTGCDAQKISVDISPRTEYVAPLSSITLNVRVTPMETGVVLHSYMPCFIGRVLEPIILSIQCQVEGLNVTFHMPKTQSDTLFTIKDQLNVTQIPWSTRGRDIVGSLAGKKTGECACKIRRKTSPVSVQALDWDDDEENNLEVVDSTECELHHQAEPELRPTTTSEYFPSEQELGGEEDSGPQQLMQRSAPELSSHLEIQGEIEAPELKESCKSAPELVWAREMDDEVVDKLPPPADSNTRTEEGNGNTLGEEGNTDKAPFQLREISAFCREMQPSLTQEFLDKLHRDVVLLLKPMYLKVVDIDEVPVEEEPVEPEEPPPPVPVSRNSLLEWLRSRAVMEFLDIPLNRPVVQTFLLRNETPIAAAYTVTATNYPAERPPRTPDVFEEVCAMFSNRQIDKWQTCMQEGSGLFVMLEPSCGILRAHEAVPINVLVYADTWGCYREKIVCSIVGLPPFDIHTKISVLTHPVAFPITLNCTNPEPVLRFGCVLYRSPPQTRIVRVRNSSSIELRISWNTFVERVGNKPVDSEMPVSLVLDLFTPFKEGEKHARRGRPHVRLQPSVKTIYPIEPSDEPSAPPSTPVDQMLEYGLEMGAQPQRSGYSGSKSGVAQYCYKHPRVKVVRSRPKNTKRRLVKPRAASADHTLASLRQDLAYDGGTEPPTPVTRMHSTDLQVLSWPYIGLPDRDLFKVNPGETILPPHSESVITVTLDPSSSVRRVGEEREDLAGVAVGSVRVAYDDCHGSTFYRPSGDKLPPARIRLEVSLEVPELELRGDLHFRVYASQIFSSSRSYTESRTMFLHNHHHSPMSLEVNSCKPFSVKRLAARINERHKAVNQCTILEGECAEVCLELCLTKNDALQALEIVGDTTQPGVEVNDYQKTLTYTRPLTIVQKNVHEQTFNLVVMMVFPIVQVERAELRFGPVYAKETKHLTLWLQNKSAVPVNFKVRTEGHGYSVSPTCGVLPSTPKHLFKAVVLDVSFRPKTRLESHGKLLIETDIPEPPIVVFLHGHRSLNEKYMAKGF